MNKLRLYWVRVVSTIIWSIEKVFFYPKLFNAYRDINLIDNATLGITIFDVGANKGQSISFFKGIYPLSKVFAFEPSQKTFYSLRKFVEDNSYQNISIFQIGIGEIQGTMNFYESVLDETSSFVLPNQDSQYLRNKNRILFQKNDNAFHAVTTQITTLDIFIQEKEIARVDILKIDVEGFEFEVLRGAQNALLNGKIGIIQLERHSDDMREDKYPIIHELLLENGFIQIQAIKHPFGNFQEILYQGVKNHL